LNKAEFTDATIAGALRERTLTAGQRIVNTDDAAIRDYLHRISGDDFKTKDFRTWHGTSTALTALQGRAQPQGEKEFTKMQRDVAKAVAAHLGNTPAVALKYYIDPAVWQKWTP
jgi:DNA topoisomerase-1